MDNIILPEGIPNTQLYRQLLNTPHFKQIESFSNAFLNRNHVSLKNYSRKWVANPLKQWSRQYEYPFTGQEIAKYASQTDNPQLKILDAGSGITFFPFYLKNQNPQYQVDCCDYDDLGSSFTEISETMDSNINFLRSNITDIPKEDNTYDIIYCISVLEHTENYKAVIQEFKRLLKNEGQLVITFDISLDNHSDIPIDQAEELIQELENEFQSDQNFTQKDYLQGIKHQNILTTKYIKDFDKSLLPWKYPYLQALKKLLKLKFPISAINDLTCFCISLKKTT